MNFEGSYGRVFSGLDCDITENAPMSQYTSFRTGGNADVLITPHTPGALREILYVCADKGIKCTVIGNGSNLLVSDSGIRGAVIRTASGLCDMHIEDDGVIFCEAGVPLSKLCLFALENSLTGLEFAYGIPGTAGGAAYMNAGAYGGEMKDVLLRCSHITPSFENASLENEEMCLGYRTSIYASNGCTITDMRIALSRADKNDIRAKMDELLLRRKEKQPLEYPSAGSTFKRPQGNYAGALIEQCGLKGFAVGGAQVSEKHAGFVINRGGATTQDIVNLMEHIKKTVLGQTGVLLEPEVKII